MCGDWISLDDEIARILEGLTGADTGEGFASTPVTALAGEEVGRAHAARGDGGVVLEFVPKKAGPKPDQFVWEEATVPVRMTVTTGTAGLSYRMAREG